MITIVATALLLSFFYSIILADSSKTSGDLAGAWRGKVQLNTSVFSSMKDLEFMYVFNAGGTMTESSNYDAAPPGPPAYGLWKKTGPGHYESKYLVFQTKAVSILDEIGKGGGWIPDGYGVLTEKITLSQDGDIFDSTIKFEIFDRDGKITAKGGEGVVKGTRIKF